MPVPEGRFDGSLARSAWSGVRNHARPGGTAEANRLAVEQQLTMSRSRRERLS
jgi:hypothetical protein